MSCLFAKKKEFKWMFLGLDGAGKTSLLKCIAGEDITKVYPTQGFNIRHFAMDQAVLNVWDIGGAKGLRSYWHTYCDNCQGCFFVIDASDEDRLTESGLHLMNFLDEDIMERVPLLIFANKKDKQGALDIEKVASNDARSASD